MRNYFVIALITLCMMLAGCETSASYYGARNDPFIGINYQAADALIASANAKRAVQQDAPLLVATVVNIDSLTESSRLGRIISEQIQGRLTQQGYSVVELKLRGQIFVKRDQGELLLSREVKDISTNHNAQAVIVGTYAVANDLVYVNLKAVGNDNIVLGAYDYTLPLEANVKALLKKPCC